MTAPSDPSPTYEHCQHLAEVGKLDEALAALEQYLAHHPEDGAAMNDVGAILYTRGRLGEAADWLRRAVQRLGPQSGQALWNLAEVCLAAKRPADARALFPDLAREGLLTPDLANRTARLHLDAGDKAGAVEVLLESLRLDPGQRVVEAALVAIRAHRPKVTFFIEGVAEKAVDALARELGLRYRTRTCRPTCGGDVLANMARCDIAWFEGCTQQVVVASKARMPRRRVVRLHGPEAYTDLAREVLWENIDALLLPGNPVLRERLRLIVPDLEQRTRILDIPRGVDLERFALTDRPRGKNLACVGNLSLTANPMLLLQCFQRLHAADPEYRLFFAGQYEDSGVLAAYVADMVGRLGLADAVRFDGPLADPAPPGLSPAAWLEDKHYVVTASLDQAQPMAVLEAMARGLKPVVHAFPGASAFFPDALLYRTVEEFCGRILAEPYEPAAYRALVEERFSLERELEAVQALLLEWESSPAPGQAGPRPDAAAAGSALPDEVAAGSAERG